MESSGVDVDLGTVCTGADALCHKETSPDSKCPICLDHFRNVSYADRCFHRFCFCCILEWGKNKAECPLCKQPFSSVYHSIRSEDDFKLYQLRPGENGSFGNVLGQRFRYRTTLMHRRRTETRTRQSLRQQEVIRFRRRLYRRGLRVRDVRDGGRSRDTSARFFRKNPACLHRLVPWLKRELAVLYGTSDLVADVVLHMILSLITRQDMQDDSFLQELRPFLTSRTEHFMHEFQSFAKSPFNMEAYDRQAVYDCPAPSHLPSSPLTSPHLTISEADADLRSGPSPWDDETPGPSYSTYTQSVFTVTITDSDPDSASENEERANANTQADHSNDGDCIIIGFIKPTSQRTPELVQLSSDSEASVQEEPCTSNQSDTREPTNQRSQNSKSSQRERNRDCSSHDHRRHSRPISNNHRRRSKEANYSSPSRRQRRQSRYTDTHYSQHSPAHSQSKTHSPSHRFTTRTRSRTPAYAWVRKRTCSGYSCRTRSRSRTHAHSRSRSRSCSRSRTHANPWTRAHARSGSRTCEPSGSRTRAHSRPRIYAHSRSRSRPRSQSRTCEPSGSRTRARSRSRTRVCSYRDHRGIQTSLQNRKLSPCLSVSPRRSSHRKVVQEKSCVAQKHNSLNDERRRSRSKERHHKKKKKGRRQSSSMEGGAKRRKRHKKKKHKTIMKNRSESKAWGSRSSTPTIITINTDTQSAEEATPQDHSHALSNTTPPNNSHASDSAPPPHPRTVETLL